MKASPFLAILADESADVSTQEELILCVRYLDPQAAEVSTNFLSIRKLPNKMAETIESVVLDVLKEKAIDLKKVVGVGTDGAANMAGKRSGLIARLKEKNPHLTGHHCTAHRLNLASSQASEAVPYLKKLKAILKQLFYFYSTSPTRRAGLDDIQALLDDPKLRLKKAVDTRWLSRNAAVHTIRRILPSLISSLEREATERNNATDSGLSTFVKDFYFVASIYLLSDVLPVMTSLSKIFQGEKLDFTVRSSVDGALLTPKRLRTMPGMYMQQLKGEVKKLAEFGVKMSLKQIVQRESRKEVPGQSDQQSRRQDY